MNHPLNDHDDMHESFVNVDPTPIHHPVDNEALETAVHETAEHVGVEGGVDSTPHHAHGHHHDHHPQDQHHHYPFSTTKEEDLAQRQPRKRIRRAGKVEISHKPRKIEEDDHHDDGGGVGGGGGHEDDDFDGDDRRHPFLRTTMRHSTLEIQALADDPSDPVRQEAAARVLAAEAAIPKVISKHEEKWNWMFDRLLEFREKFNHTNVPQMYADAPRLGRWVHYQRVEYWVFQETGGGKINPDRIRKLEAINFEWNPQESQWKIMYERLQAFQEEMGHCKVPKGYQKDVELANWVRNQRLEHANYLKGKKSRMTAERYHKLSTLGFKWSSLAANKVVNPMPFHDEEADATPVKEEATEEAPVEACIVEEKEGRETTSEV